MSQKERQFLTFGTERERRQTGERDFHRELWPVQWRQCGPLLASCGICRGRGVAAGCVILRDQLEAHGRSRGSRDISTSTRAVANSRKTMKFPFPWVFPGFARGNTAQPSMSQPESDMCGLVSPLSLFIPHCLYLLSSV